MQFYTAFWGFLIDLYYLTAFEYKEFGKFTLTKSDVFKIFVKFPDFSWPCSNPEKKMLFIKMT